MSLALQAASGREGASPTIAADANSDANPVRNPGAVRNGAVVQIRYTDFAQVKCRFHTLFGPSAEEAVQKLLGELQLQPRNVRVRALEAGDVAVLRRMPVDAPVHLQPQTVQPVAFVEGLSESELAASLAALADARWALT